MRITKNDEELISQAIEIINKNKDLYKQKDLIVGAVLKTRSGNIYKGINIKTSHSVCAEQVALGQALANGEREFDTIVAVKFNKGGMIRVVSPCGLCRYILDNLDMDINVLVEDEKTGKVLKVKASELLPYPYNRNI